MAFTIVKPKKLHAGFRTFRDYLVTMLAFIALSFFVYGWRVILMFAIAALTALFCDVAAALLRGQNLDITDISSVTFAWIFTMLMPASISYGVLILGICVTLLLGKHAFGGYGHYPFHPVAFGYAFTAICFTDDVFLYPEHSSDLGLGWTVDTELMNSPAYMLRQGGDPGISRTDLLLGNFEGPIGAGFCLVALACIVLLIVHKATTWHVPAGFAVTCAVWAVLLPRISVSAFDSVILEMSTGTIPFAAAYLVAEPTSCPKNKTAKVIYGIVLGIVTMLYSRYGAYESGVCFALLICSPFVYWIDRFIGTGRFARRKGKDAV